MKGLPLHTPKTWKERASQVLRTLWFWVKPVQVDYREYRYDSLLDWDQEWPPEIIGRWAAAERGELPQSVIYGLSKEYPAFKKFLEGDDTETGDWVEGRPFTQAGGSSPCPFKT